MRAVGKTDTGILRNNNEDTIYVFETEGRLENLCIVADGMGGHNAGEIAAVPPLSFFLSILRPDMIEANLKIYFILWRTR